MSNLPLHPLTIRRTIHGTHPILPSDRVNLVGSQHANAGGSIHGKTPKITDHHYILPQWMSVEATVQTQSTVNATMTMAVRNEREAYHYKPNNNNNNKNCPLFFLTASLPSNLNHGTDHCTIVIVLLSIEIT
jgi:hypothetical protein